MVVKEKMKKIIINTAAVGVAIGFTAEIIANSPVRPFQFF